MAAELEKVEADKKLSEMHKAKVEANRLDTFELNETKGPWITNMTEDQAIIIRTWISTLKEDHIAKLYNIKDMKFLKQQ
eukprot:11016862-Heterocapsa_arctica.AAC.1